MHFGLVLECDYREGATQKEAFEEAFADVEMAETVGLDGVWLAENHFAPPQGMSGEEGSPIPSVVSAPMIMASAIAARTTRLRIGLAVNVLPLTHPLRVAEEAATVDHISRGRFEFGIGRSGLPVAYEGYGIPYSESRERFWESLDIILGAWTNDKFSYQGKYYSFNDVCVLPKPYQKPYPPTRIAATTEDTFPQVGGKGYPAFVGVRGMTLGELAHNLKEYRRSWKEAGHAGSGDVILRIPIYVAETAELARSEPELSTVRLNRRLAERVARAAAESGTWVAKERAERARRTAEASYDDLLRDILVYGTPEAVVERITEIREELHLSGVIADMNVGGLIPQERVLNSIRLFGEQVAPEFR